MIINIECNRVRSRQTLKQMVILGPVWIVHLYGYLLMSGAPIMKRLRDSGNLSRAARAKIFHDVDLTTTSYQPEAWPKPSTATRWKLNACFEESKLKLLGCICAEDSASPSPWHSTPSLLCRDSRYAVSFPIGGEIPTERWIAKI